MSQEKIKTREDYEAAQTGEFTNLFSDIALRGEVAALKFEDKGDREIASIILKRKVLCQSQRRWFHALIERKGGKFK